jgi:RHS repeat-associated protein
VTSVVQTKAFGAPAGGWTSNFTLPRRYTGELQDPDSRLTYIRARWYQPGLGRFLTRDSFGGYAFNPQSQNRYAYSK